MAAAGEKEVGRQQTALIALMLIGSYSINGAWLRESGGGLLLSWLAAVLAAGLSVAVLAYLEPRLMKLETVAVPWQILFSAYLLLLAGLYLRGTAALWQQWDLEQTPRLLLGLGLAALTVYGGWSGEKASARLALPVLFWLLLTAVLDLLVLLPEASFARLELDVASVDAGFSLSLFASLLLPLLAVRGRREDGRLNRKPLACGVAIGGLYLLSVILRPLLLLGELALGTPYPILRTLMLVAVGPTWTHLEFGGILAISAAVLTASGAASARLFSLPLWQGRRRWLAALALAVWTAVVFLPLPYLH